MEWSPIAPAKRPTADRRRRGSTATGPVRTRHCLSQPVGIPAECAATSSFWLHIDTAETTTSTAYDKLCVKMSATTLATYSNLDYNTGFIQKNIDASAFIETEDDLKRNILVIGDTRSPCTDPKSRRPEAP